MLEKLPWVLAGCGPSPGPSDSLLISFGKFSRLHAVVMLRICVSSLVILCISLIHTLLRHCCSLSLSLEALWFSHSLWITYQHFNRLLSSGFSSAWAAFRIVCQAASLLCWKSSLILSREKHSFSMTFKTNLPQMPMALDSALATSSVTLFCLLFAHTSYTLPSRCLL